MLHILVVCSFALHSSIPLYDHTVVYLAILWSMKIYVFLIWSCYEQSSYSCTHFFMYIYFCLGFLSFTILKWLDRFTIYQTSWENVWPIHKTVIWFYSPINHRENSNWFSPLLPFSTVSHFKFSHSSGFIVVSNSSLIFISFITNIIENLSMILFPTYISSILTV